MFKISVANQKGGVGKSTTAINLSAGLAYSGKRVLLVDLDSQGHSSLGLGIQTEGRQTIAELLCQDNCSPQDVIQSTYIETLDLIPADSSLAAAEYKLSQMRSKEFVLRNKLTNLNYDYIIIDTSPTFNILLTNAFLLAEHIILPVQLSYFSVAGVSSFLDVIKHANTRAGSLVNHHAQIMGVLFTFFKTNSKLSKRVLETLNELFKDKVFETKIPENVKLSEAQEMSRSIFDHAPESPGSKSYARLVNEVITRLESVRT